MKSLICLFVISTTASFASTKIHYPRSTGNDFYIVFPKAAWGNQNVGVLISSPTAQHISITEAGGSIKDDVHIQQPRSTSYVGNVFPIVDKPGFIYTKGAAHLQSVDPISVVGQFGIAGISGTYTAIPVTSWGTEYYAVAPQEGTNQDYYYYPTIYSVPMITIIASHNGTVVEILPTAKTAMGNEANTPFSITLNAGDVYNITTAADPKAIARQESPCEADLTGSHVTSNFPIGMICSQSHSTWPCGYNDCGDYCVEFIPPVSAWDSLYLITPSVPRLGGLAGEQLRIVFAHNGTDLIIDDGLSSPRDVGTYSAGQWIDYPSPIENAVVVAATHPFLPVEFTTKPAACQAGTSGGENWTLSMVIIPGANEWSDDTPFTTAIGSTSVANICFRYKQLDNLKLNGVPLRQVSQSTIKLLQQGFATFPMSINAGAYYELTGDNGATAGGTIFGYGTSTFTPSNGNNNEHTLAPEVIKSFGHPLGGNFTQLNYTDTVAPSIDDIISCAHWSVTTTDNADDPNSSGLAFISMSSKDSVDSSYNVAFAPAPKYSYGDVSVTFGVDVVNPLQPAQAWILVRDMAGNEYDTLLRYTPIVTDVAPTLADAGIVAVGARTNISMTLKNHGDSVATLQNIRLQSGTHWKILTPLSFPLQISSGDSLELQLQYAPLGETFFAFDRDTLLVTTCREFALGAMVGKPQLPGIMTTCYAFGNAIADTLSFGGDTLSSGKNIWATNVGGDTLHITGLLFSGSVLPPDPTFPESDFGIRSIFRRDGTPLATPTPAAPWSLAVGDTVFVTLWAHPHHVGARNAILQFRSDALHVPDDTACLSIVGEQVDILASSVDYGTRLYGTTVDSFFVVWNTGNSDFIIYKHGFELNSAADSLAFVFHSYRDTITHSYVYYDSTVDNQLLARDVVKGTPGDTTRVPYRFIANTLGADSITVRVINSSPTQPTIALRGNVVQPHVAAISACPPDMVKPGDTLHAVIRIWNIGTDSLTLQSLSIEGVLAAQWSIDGIVRSHNHQLRTAPINSVLLMPAVDTCYVVLHTIATSSQYPSTSLHAKGNDGLNRGAADSVNGVVYKWSVFPYDTIVPIFSTPCIVGVDEYAAMIPSQPVLYPLQPNPFATLTNIHFSLASESHVTLRITNILGETITTIINESRNAGTYVVPWDASDAPTGIYFCELFVAGRMMMQRIIKL